MPPLSGVRWHSILSRLANAEGCPGPDCAWAELSTRARLCSVPSASTCFCPPLYIQRCCKMVPTYLGLKMIIFRTCVKCSNRTFERYGMIMEITVVCTIATDRLQFSITSGASTPSEPARTEPAQAAAAGSSRRGQPAVPSGADSGGAVGRQASLTISIAAVAEPCALCTPCGTVH